MFYDEIIYLFLAMILWGGWPRQAGPPLVLTAVLFVLKDLVWVLLARHRLATASDALEFAVRQRALLRWALLFFLADVTLLGLPARLSHEAWAILLYGQYLLLVWYIAGRYERRQHLTGLSPGRYLLSQIRFFLPAVFPWILASLGIGLVERFVSGVPDYLLWTLGLFLLGVFFPYLAVKLWPTRSLPASSLRTEIENYLRRVGVRLGDIRLWLAFEGKLLTAGVLGVLPPFRYLLISPGLLATLNEEEILSVVAHEAGHVKHRHLWWLLFFLLVFLFLLYRVLEPAWWLFLSLFPYPKLFVSGDFRLRLWPEIVLAVILGGVVFFYFRYFLGYFLRNFERQADLFALESLGSARGIIAALEKIATLSGLREAPSWHHYSLAERIAFLHAASADSRLVQKHHRALSRRKRLFLLLVLGLLGAATLGDHNLLKKKALRNILRGVEARAEGQPEILRALADYLLSQGLEKEALSVYEKVLAKSPRDPWALNNLAWLLLTASDPSLRNPGKALELSRKAARLKPSAAILDTLAEAYYQNGDGDRACDLARKALSRAREEKIRGLDYYMKRKNMFCRHASASS